MTRISGEHALPQPEDILDLTNAGWVPSLPDEVLRREALIRSFRWAYLAYPLVMVISVIGAVSGNGAADGGLVEITCAFLGSAICGAVFWALHRPRKLTRTILSGLAVLTCLIVFLTVSRSYVISAFSDSGDSFRREFLLSLAVNCIPEIAVSMGLVYLSHRGPGRILYSAEGLGYFERRSPERMPENLTLALSLVAFICLRSFIPHAELIALPKSGVATSTLSPYRAQKPWC